MIRNPWHDCPWTYRHQAALVWWHYTFCFVFCWPNHHPLESVSPRSFYNPIGEAGRLHPSLAAESQVYPAYPVVVRLVVWHLVQVLDSVNSYTVSVSFWRDVFMFLFSFHRLQSGFDVQLTHSQDIFNCQGPLPTRGDLEVSSRAPWSVWRFCRSIM